YIISDVLKNTTNSAQLGCSAKLHHNSIFK
ncbi:MAG: hypothetical protein ACI9T8_000588, partial [Candidatus Saccharimonadales bacterium]